jgi:hypothetical protein
MTDARQAYIDGLHQIADFLAEHPEVPLPYMGSYATGEFVPTMSVYLVGDENARETLATIARALGRVEKRVSDTTERFMVHRKFAGIAFAASADRSEVCERVVTGTREVTTEVPDPEALAAVPKVSVTTVVEDVEWVCSPLLKPTAGALQFVEVPS